MACKLWIDKYRPLSLDQLDFHTQQCELLRQLARSGDLPHLLFYGPSGAGKKTRVLAVLNELFGPGVYKVKCETRSFKAGSSSNVDITVLQSNYHIDMTPSDVWHHDKVVVQKIIKEIGSSRNPDMRSFKVVILNQADQLTHEAQASLRRTIEKYTATTRIVLVCNSLSRVIGPLRSRCLGIRVPAPENTDIRNILRFIASRENVDLPEPFIDRVIAFSNRNLRRAIMAIQTTYIQFGKISTDTQLPPPEWEKYLHDVATNVLEEQSPKRLKLVRSKLYEVLASCIPPSTIFRFLTKEILARTDSELKYEVIKFATHYQVQMMQGTKPIMHIEAFLAKFMSLYKKHITLYYRT